MNRLGLGHDVQIASPGDEQPAVGEKLQVAALAAGGLAHPLGDDPQLAPLRGVERQQAVGLAEVIPLKDNGFGSIKAFSAHTAPLTLPSLCCIYMAAPSSQPSCVGRWPRRQGPEPREGAGCE